MARRTTLKDLNEFLSQNPNTIEIDDVRSKEDYIKKSPNNLVDIEDLSSKTKKTPNQLANVSMAEIAQYLHSQSQKQDTSFTELWLSIIEEGAKIDPLLKNTNALKTLKTINKTTFNVAMEGLVKVIKGQK